MHIKNILKKDQAIVNAAIKKHLLSKKKSCPPGLYKALEYSVLAGGKRIRPVLMLAVAELLGKPKKRVLASACAVEFLHTSTLILDDMPCIDNSNLRRGKPTTHINFNEATAILSSYALSMLGFELISKNLRQCNVGTMASRKLIDSISCAMGTGGVVGGEYQDCGINSKKVPRRTIEQIHFKKTACLFISCCEVAGLLCGGSDVKIKALRSYGRNLGLAFQMADDILSVTVSDKRLGKQTNGDKDTLNFVNIFGMEKARKDLLGYMRKGKESLNVFGKRGEFLRELLEFAGGRSK